MEDRRGIRPREAGAPSYSIQSTVPARSPGPERVASIPVIKISSVSSVPPTSLKKTKPAPSAEEKKQAAAPKILKDSKDKQNDSKDKQSDSLRRRSSVNDSSQRRSSVSEKREALFDRQLDVVIERQISQRMG